MNHVDLKSLTDSTEPTSSSPVDSVIKNSGAGHWLVLGIVLLGLLLRLYWISVEFPVFEGDECEYLRLAQNLVEHGTYVGLFEGPEVMYPPLFPALIAAFSFVTGSYETAGKLVTLLAGLGLIVAIFALARRLYGLRIGVIAAILAAFHPAFICLSGALYSESVYVPLVVAGVLFAVQYAEQQSIGSAVVSGVCFGLAYLTRPEALLYPFAILLTLALMAGIAKMLPAKALGKALLIPVAAVAFAIPYATWLTMQTGKVQWEGKSAMNIAIANRINAGMSQAEAVFGVGADLHEDGPWLSPNLWVLEAQPSVPLGRLMLYWMKTTPRNLKELVHVLLSAWFGSVAMVVLVTLGLLGHAWSRRRILREAMLLAVVLSYTSILLGQHFLTFRYLLPLLVFQIVWAANGIGLVSRWFEHTSRHVTGHNCQIVKWFGTGGGIIAAGLVLVISAHGVTSGGMLRSSNPIENYIREAGTWLAQYSPGPKRVMSTTNEMAYYASGTALRLPFAESGLAERYILAQAPDFICLVSGEEPLPYYHDWFEHGIPSSQARLIHRVTDPTGVPQVMIYDWRRS